jgi:hypothetical protein
MGPAIDRPAVATRAAQQTNRKCSVPARITAGESLALKLGKIGLAKHSKKLLRMYSLGCCARLSQSEGLISSK